MKVLIPRSPLTFAILLAFSVPVPAQGKVVKGVVGHGSAAIVGITAEQGQRIALQRARADAIAQAAGVHLISSTLVRNQAVVGDVIKTFTQGFIVREQVKWDPLDSLAMAEDAPQIPLYKVMVIADVAVPEKHLDPGFLLHARLNRDIFQAGEQATLIIETSQPAQVAIFNLMADDHIRMLAPLRNGTALHTIPHQPLYFPEQDSDMVLEMTTLEGHERDNEAMLVAAVPVQEGRESDVFSGFIPGKSYSFEEFFTIYAGMADRVNEVMVPYQVLRRR